ncbi:MAG: hypothetical protein O2931_16020, partial [Planctomycetota bacterium]|nr:hypothetical protein [Planctomycetota bacterium]
KWDHIPKILSGSRAWAEKKSAPTPNRHAIGRRVVDPAVIIATINPIEPPGICRGCQQRHEEIPK